MVMDIFYEPLFLFCIFVQCNFNYNPITNPQEINHKP